MLYVHQYPDWTHFRYDSHAVMNALGVVRRTQGKLIGLAEICGVNELEAEIIAKEIAASFSIDGLDLNLDDIRDDVEKRSKASRNFVINSLGAVQNANAALTTERIFNWHGALSKKNPFRFRTIDNALKRIASTQKNDSKNSSLSQELNFVGPHHESLNKLVENFLSWFETAPLDGIVKAAIAQFWFLTLRPFEEANGRLARMISGMQLVRSSDFSKYLYSVNSEILKHRDEYFNILNKAQRSSGDITEWILWFLQMLQSAMEDSLQSLAAKASQIQFKQRFAQVALDIREQMLVDAAMNGKLPEQFSAKDVAAIIEASHDTALRLIQGLIAKGVFKPAGKGGRSQKYSLV